MELVAMNKTEIISFIIDESTPKLWNVSSKMRKKLIWMLKDKTITIKEYNEKVFKLTKWVNIQDLPFWIEDLRNVKPGIANYSINSQEELNKIQSLNGETRCDTINLTSEKPISIAKVTELEVFPKNLTDILQYSIDKLDILNIRDLSQEQIESVVAKINSIKAIRLSNISIDTLDLSKVKARKISLSEVKIKSELSLPSNLEHLSVYMCKPTDRLKFNRITEIELTVLLLGEHSHWVSRVKGLKKVETDSFANFLIDCLPSTVVRVKSCGFEKTSKDATKKIKEKLPNLRLLNNQIPLSYAEKLNLREVNLSKFDQDYEYTIKPRKILINKDNADLFEKYADLFGESTYFVLESESFNFDLFPEKVRKIEIFSLNKESCFIIRFY